VPRSAPAPAQTAHNTSASASPKGIYGNIPPRAGRASPNTTPFTSARNATSAADDGGIAERSEDKPMNLIRAESPVIGKQNQALSQGRSAHETLPAASGGKHHKHHHHKHGHKDTKSASAAADVPPPIAPIRSSYSRVNPLSSASSEHPVLRVLGDDEAELMEPSLMGQARYGSSPFPGPSLDEDASSTGEYVDDYNSDEDRMSAIRAYHMEKYEGIRVSSSSNNSASSYGGSSSSVQCTREADTLGSLNRSLNSRASEGPSTLETDSILAIEARYR